MRAAWLGLHSVQTRSSFVLTNRPFTAQSRLRERGTVDVTPDSVMSAERDPGSYLEMQGRGGQCVGKTIDLRAIGL